MAGASQLLAVDDDELRTLQFVLTIVMRYIRTYIRTFTGGYNALPLATFNVILLLCKTHSKAVLQFTGLRS